MSKDLPASLPMAGAVLRSLVVLNWLYGGAILVLLLATVLAEQWTLGALGVPRTSPMRPILPGLRAIAVFGLIAIPLNYRILRQLLAMVDTVRRGDAFIAANATRLRTIARALLALQLISMLVGGIGKALSTPAYPVHLDAGFSVSGWLAVLMACVLAHVFAEGARMREDLAGTV